MRKKLIILLCLFIPLALYSQEEKKFTPYGKPVLMTFSNVHYSFNKDGANPAFELTRLYLGYEYFFSSSLSARAVLDIGDPGVGGLQMTAYAKNAFMLYKKEKFSGRFGLIGTDAFSVIEKQWGHRYIMKTLQDEYGFNSSADLGAGVEYSPAKIISFDASVLNGEGYKRIQSDTILKYTAGITILPAAGLLLRVYTDFMKKNYMQNTLSFFGGYTHGNLKVGLEYSTQTNNKVTDGHDFSGISAFVSMKIDEKLGVFARYDKLSSGTMISEENPWNYNKDGQMFLAGIEFSPVSGVRIAPVYIGWLPANSAKPFTSTPGIHFELKF